MRINSTKCCSQSWRFEVVVFHRLLKKNQWMIYCKSRTMAWFQVVRTATMLGHPRSLKVQQKGFIKHHKAIPYHIHCCVFNNVYSWMVSYSNFSPHVVANTGHLWADQLWSQSPTDAYANKTNLYQQCLYTIYNELYHVYT